MKTIAPKPLFWRLSTLLSLGTDHVHELALRASGSLTSLRLLLGRCLLALHESKGYKQFGCSSSVHYATQIIGVGTREARECRRVARELQPLAELTLAAEQGKIAWSKLRDIVRKASPETGGYWLALCQKFNAEQIQELVRKTPWGSLPGEVFDEDESMSTELRCPMSPRVFRMLAQARRLYSIEQEEAVTNADIVEMALVSYIAGRPVDTELLEKTRDEADKDLQAEEARRLPLVYQARELAEEMGLLGEGTAEEQSEDEQSPLHKESLAQALGAEPIDLQAESSVHPNEASVSVAECALQSVTLTQSTPDPERHSWVVAHPSHHTKLPASLQLPQAPWTNPGLRFNPKSRFTTKAQRKEILRRDCWKCSTPGCGNRIFLEIHHLIEYSKGGKTEPQSLVSLCSGCHRNLHSGVLQIKVKGDGGLLFLDGEDRRLDRHSKLEVAGWLDWWHGWKGREEDSP